MRGVVFIPVDLIKRADNEGWLRSLAYFVRLKSLYKNNTHYNFTLRGLAAHMKCSPTCLSAHLKVLTEKGLVEKHGKNLTFRGLKKLSGKFDKKAKCIGVPINHKFQYDVLRAQVIRFNLSAQEYNIRKSGRQIQSFGNVPNNYREKIDSCYIGLSALGIGNLFGLSGSTGSRLRKKLVKMKLLKVMRVFTVLFEGVTLKQYKSMKWAGYIPVYARYIGGNILLEKRNRIEYIGVES